MDGKIDNSIPRRQDVSEHVERTWEVLHETSCKCSLKDSSLLPTIFILFFEGGVVRHLYILLGILECLSSNSGN